jgi:heptosyltransferase III
MLYKSSNLERIMHSFGNILIFHPAAIGDAMLATPVAKTLKLNFPGAKLTYCSHSSLRQLIFGLNPSVDEFIDFSKDVSFFDLYKTFAKLKPDLFVDLSNSAKGRWLSMLITEHGLRYIKRDPGGYGSMHAVNNFLETVEPICQELPEALFPTIFPEGLATELLPKLFAQAKISAKPIIGLVIGVGNLRPHRAWPQDGWIYLIRAIISRQTHMPVLIGGEDEVELSSKIAEEFGDSCLNLVGKLALTETAAVLKSCKVVVSADTGPAHMAVAVGTPVIGLYGPTLLKRSGPYGYENLALSQSDACQCLQLKTCRLTALNQPGECMSRIMLPEIVEKIGMIIESFRGPDTNAAMPKYSTEGLEQEELQAISEPEYLVENRYGLETEARSEDLYSPQENSEQQRELEQP